MLTDNVNIKEFRAQTNLQSEKTFISSRAGICRVGEICPVLNRPAEAII